MQIQIKGKVIHEDDGIVTLTVPLEESHQINATVREFTDRLIAAGVPRRIAYGLTEDVSDGIFRDAVASLVNPNH